MRTVYLGTSEFAAQVLRALAASEHRPALVVTRPDRPAGRGRRVTAPPVAEAARELGLDLDQPEDVNGDEARARISAADPQAVVVCAFGALIKPPLLDEHLMLNVHPSLLPRWRGAAPIERAIMAGDGDTGVTIMKLTEGLDSGPICLAEREHIEPADTYGTLAPRLADLGARLLIRALDDEHLAFTDQIDTYATYADKIGPDDRTLDPEAPAMDQDRTVRALHPHIGARLQLEDGSFLGVLETRVTPDGELELVTVQPPGGRPMAYADYLRGHART